MTVSPALVEPRTPGSGKLVHLEAGRGIASIIVVMHHFSFAFAGWIKAPFSEGGLGNTPLQFLADGSLAVNFFFVLSGFVLSLAFFRRFTFRGWSVAVVKRLPRLWLPVAISVLAGLLLLTYGGGIWRDAAELSGSDWLRAFAGANNLDTANASLPDALRQSVAVFLHRDDNYYNTNLWTMFFEYYGSVAIYGLILVVAVLGGLHSFPRALMLLVAAVALALLSGRNFILFYFTAFFAGALLAGIWSSGRLSFRLHWALNVLLIGLFLWIASGEIGTMSVKGTSASLILMVLLLQPSRIVDRLSGNTGRWLGEISFPLYLVHTLVILGPGSYVYVAFHDVLSPAALVLVTLATVMGLSFALAIPLARLDIWWVRWINDATRKAVDRLPKPPVPQRLRNRADLPPPQE